MDLIVNGNRQELDEFFWGDLLDYIDDGHVIPIVESGALRVDAGDQPITLDSLIAARLAERLRLDLGELQRPPRVDDVVSRYLAGPRTRKEDLYVRTLQVLKDLELAPLPALADLAAIRCLDLFVSVSFDLQLERAIDAVRHQGQARTETISFSPNRNADLPGPRAGLLRPTVFHLLGRLSSAPDSVICDDDRLEFLHALQEDARRPKLLFDELRDNHLLLIGCRFPDWAARFFLRTAKNDRLSAHRDTVEYLVGIQSANDRRLVAFLADFSPGTKLVAAEPEDFVAELRRQWEARHPPGQPSAGAAPPAPAAAEPSDGVVFISYSSDDLDAARTLARALDAAGIDVWFDQAELHCGDAWERKILRGLDNSALFIPLVSESTQREERRRAFFWREWNAAHERAGSMAPDEVFILPVTIDGIQPYRALVPERFNARQWTPLPGGVPTAGFVDAVRAHYRAYQQRGARARA